MKMMLQKKYGKIATLEIDGEPWRDVHTSIIKRTTTKEGFAAAELKGAKQWALKRLAARNTSSFELRKLLKERLVSSSAIELVIEECQYYLDDEAWIEGLIQSEVRKGKGARFILQKLLAKGVPKEVAEEAVSKLDASHLGDLIKKELAKGKEKQKIIASFLRKGFSWDEISSCF